MGASVTASAVELKNAGKTYGKVKALHNISLTIDPGEVVAFLGPNGAGKTTAISLMLGLRPPSSGSVTIYGGNPREARNRRRIGAMLQESGVPAMLSVREVVSLFGHLYTNSLSTQTALEMAQLADRAGTHVGKLSGGQKQRLYFALALVGNPDILFLDEPTTGLDVEARRNFWTCIGNLIDLGKTIVLTTHNLEEADTLAKRIVVINLGEIVAEGTPQQIKGHIRGKHIRFRAAPDEQATLGNLVGVQRVDRLDDRFDLYSVDPEATLAALMNSDITINDIEITGAGLEEAFLSIIQKQ